LELANGIPSNDTFRRVILALQPDEFEACFQKWTKAISDHQSDIIAIPKLLEMLVLNGFVLTIDAMEYNTPRI